MINKKYIITVVVVLTLVIISLVIFTNSKNKKAQISIENDSPTKVVNPNDKIELENSHTEAMYDSIKVFDNEEVLKRYKEVNKKYLTYDNTMKNSDDYFYEFKNGLAYNHKANKDLKPLNNKKYAMILKGYSYSNIEKSFTNEEALDTVSKVLPNDSKELTSKVFDDEKYIYYTSSKGNFIVRFGYERLYDSQNSFIGTNKDKVDSISYFKEIDVN